MTNYTVWAQFGIEMGFVVPSTASADKPVSREDYAKRIKFIALAFSTRFDAYTALPGFGGYRSKEKGLIREDCTYVYAYTTDPIKDDIEWLRQVAAALCKAWSQECIAIVVNGTLELIAPA